MLPGFRLLFATTVLAVSVLVFGLGAAALLRAAHEEFASLPSWRLAQQPVLAPQVPQLQTTPVLALLRIDPPVIKSVPAVLRPEVANPETTSARPADQVTPAEAIDTRPIAISTQTTAVIIKDAEQIAPASAPLTGQPANLNAQASVDARAVPESPTSEAKAAELGTTIEAKSAETQPLPLGVLEAKPLEDAKPLETGPAQAELFEPSPVEAKPVQTERIEIKTPESPADPRASELASFEAKASDIARVPEPTQAVGSPAGKSFATEASEPISTETVAKLERSTEATASATVPDAPVVKKARRPSARTIARRRANARARAIARAQAKAAEQLRRQQQNPFPLFGGG